ncbi:MAG TPA: SDR family NAD(P)-dependent oxidoreductase [Gaiellaceae bacterium]|nr:SDR family NAD(P)-dependent oxidoreductase [Gaiellaceae bacterium]
MSELTGQRAFVTGGGRGIGENIARELAAGGMEVAVSGRTAAQVESVASETGGRALVGDVSRREDVAGWFDELGPVDLLVANAGTGNRGVSWELDPEEWWRVFEVNVLGVHLCCSAVIPGMLERGRGRIVIVGSGASYLPGATETGYTSSKAAVCRYGETLANALEGRIPVFVISPGLVRTAMTEGHFPDDAPWTPPECAPRLVRKLASGRYDSLAGRYLHAEHSDVDALLARIDEVRERDLQAIRLQRA